MEIQIKRLRKEAKIPIYAHLGDSGFDFISTEKIIISPGHTALVQTGLSLGIPLGYELQVRPKSGISLKTKLRVSNSPGTVDSSYRGEIGILLDNIGTETITIQKGDKVAQGVICPILQVTFKEVIDLGSTTRNFGGYGSTDYPFKTIKKL